MRGLRVGGNYVWCFVIVFILLTRLGGVKKWEVRGTFYTVIICTEQATKEGEIVMEGVDPSRHH